MILERSHSVNVVLVGGLKQGARVMDRWKTARVLCSLL